MGSRLASETLAFWNDVGRKLVDMADDLPQDSYAYRPMPDVRSVAEIVHHVAEENYVYIRTERGEPVAREALRRQAVGSKTALVEFLKRSFSEGAALLKDTTDARMLAQINNPYGKRLSRLAFWLELVQHGAEHYGNLVTYYRVLGLVPPETRRAQPSSRP